MPLCFRKPQYPDALYPKPSFGFCLLLPRYPYINQVRIVETNSSTYKKVELDYFQLHYAPLSTQAGVGVQHARLKFDWGSGYRLL